jgi:phage terminase large subunit-like protein
VSVQAEQCAECGARFLTPMPDVPQPEPPEVFPFSIAERRTARLLAVAVTFTTCLVLASLVVRFWYQAEPVRWRFVVMGAAHAFINFWCVRGFLSVSGGREASIGPNLSVHEQQIPAGRIVLMLLYAGALVYLSYLAAGRGSDG